MLKILNENDLKDILNFCSGSILGTRIACYSLCYGFDKDFLTLWGDKTEKGFCCIAAKFDNSMTVLAKEGTDFDELREFLDIIGADSIALNPYIAEAMNFHEYDTKKGFLYTSESNSDYLADDANEADLKEMYSLISKVIPDSFENSTDAYLSFLSDFTFRQRRGYAKAKCVHRDGAAVSSAITSAQSDSHALISGVASDEKYRKYGYGKRTVLSLANELKNEGKTVYVIALNSSAEGFYEHIGFTECEKIAFIVRKV